MTPARRDDDGQPGQRRGGPGRLLDGDLVDQHPGYWATPHPMATGSDTAATP